MMCVQDTFLNYSFQRLTPFRSLHLQVAHAARESGNSQKGEQEDVGIGVSSSLQTFYCHCACMCDHIPEKGLAPSFQASH